MVPKDVILYPRMLYCTQGCYTVPKDAILYPRMLYCYKISRFIYLEEISVLEL